MTDPQVQSTVLTLASYWILGLCNNFGYVVMLSSAHDILNSKSEHSEHNQVSRYFEIVINGKIEKKSH